ncbi:NAD(+) diphosphatase [Butyrivibrio sp. NC2002]|uniref:NAD(+) diphosphatase n=1 Tax=Butyrivibrio sp. NC2002 TaxID=1410610 RepID=UPI00055E6FE7|nr:NAD(+) diphosphatase [Butyrivibrio sp. NC2002]
MIQDIAPEIFHNEYENTEPSSDSIVFSFCNRKILCKIEEGRGVICPRFSDLGLKKEDVIFLFKIDDRSFFLKKSDIENDGDIDGSGGFTYEDIRVLRNAYPKDLCFAGMTAYHLFVWYRDNRFCGRCAAKTEYYDKERAMICPSCKNIIYPKICPAVIVGVTCKDRILMTRYAGRAYKGNALIAGFCEIGETAEDTVRREVMEEVGLKVKNIRYFASQPWGFDSNLLLGFFCEAEDSEIKMDENELSQALFIKRSDIGSEAKNLSLTATMIMHFKEHPEDFPM